MQVIILSGGAGARLWPLSNNTRSKQFLKLFEGPDGSEESMVQRVMRQLKGSCPDVNITVVASDSQKDAIMSQLGSVVDFVPEPARRHTFPATALACSYLWSRKDVPIDEAVAVIPCDVFTDGTYFDSLSTMIDKAQKDESELYLMGVPPKCPSGRFGYILPETHNSDQIKYFVEKPQTDIAERLISEGAFWNAGVFVFRLSFMQNYLKSFCRDTDYNAIRDNFHLLPEISFDRQVVESTNSRKLFRFYGEWTDLGDWDAMSELISHKIIGNVIPHDCINTTIINELNLPVICEGTQNLIVAASPDGILVTDKTKSSHIKESVRELNSRPMYEERRWGVYKVIDNQVFPDGFCALTKQLTLNPGCSISYQRHSYRDEIWTFIDGEGEIVIDGERRPVKRGDVFIINRGQMHALRAATSLTFIEVQKGSNLIEEDIERFRFEWDEKQSRFDNKC